MYNTEYIIKGNNESFIKGFIKGFIKTLYKNA